MFGSVWEGWWVWKKTAWNLAYENKEPKQLQQSWFRVDWICQGYSIRIKQRSFAMFGSVREGWWVWEKNCMESSFFRRKQRIQAAATILISFWLNMSMVLDQSKTQKFCDVLICARGMMGLKKTACNLASSEENNESKQLQQHWFRVDWVCQGY